MRPGRLSMNLREAAAIALHAIAATYLLYLAATTAIALFLIIDDKRSSILGLFEIVADLASDRNPVSPPPGWPLAASIGAICGLTWLSGPFWCRRCGRRRHGDPEFYDRPENFVRRCRLLGGIAGVPAYIAVFVYYTAATTVPAMALYVGYWVLRVLGSIGPAIVLMIQHPYFIFQYFVKGAVFLAFLAAPFVASAAIGACLGWFYGRFVRPAIRRLLPNLLPAP